MRVKVQRKVYSYGSDVAKG